MTKEYLERQFKNYHEVTGDAITPQIFGAVGDGVTDDTQAVAQAIQNALQGSGVVYFPAGEYLVKWSGIRVSVTSDLTLFGDGMNESVIRIDAEYTTSDLQGIMFINGDSTKASNLTLKDIGIVYDDDDDTITLPDDERRTVQISGIFKNIDISSVYVHLGGSATTLPSNDLIWLQCGADNITVKDCLLENFSNREIGGSLWVTPIDADGTTVRTIKYLRILNNEIRNTNRDEGIGIWQRSSDTDFNCRDVIIDGNKVIHGDWNGECYPNNNLITGYAKSGTVIDVNYVITNNLFETHKMNSQPVRFSGLNGIIFEGNEVVVTNKSGSSGSTNNIFVVEGGGKVVVKSNAFIHKPTTNQCEFRVANNDVDFYNNSIDSGASVYFRNNTWSTSDAHVFNIVGNVIDIAAEHSQFVVRKQASLGSMIFKDNVINTGLMFNSNPVGSGLEFMSNKFNSGKSAQSTTDVKGDSMVFMYNDGITLNVSDANISTPMNNFKYIGLVENLQFMQNGSVVPDSPTVRDQFFSSSEIAYIDNPNALDDIRTDRVLIWNEEFEDFNDELSYEFRPEYNGVVQRPITDEYMSFKDSILTLKGEKKTDSSGGTSWARGHIHSKRGFRNCLIEYKAKGMGGMCLYSYVLDNGRRAYNLPHSADNGKYSTEIDIAEFYSDSDRMSHFNVHSTIDGVDTTKSVRSGQGYAETGFPGLTDDWHIFGVDMVDYKTFDFYVDRVKIGTVTHTSDTAIKDFAMFFDFNADEDKAGTLSETEMQIDWVRVYAHKNPENYVVNARGAEFISSSGKVFSGGWNGVPAKAWTPLTDGLVTEGTNEYGFPEYQFNLFLRMLPENCMIGPRIDSIEVEAGDFPYTANDIGHISMSVTPDRGTKVRVNTDIGCFEIIIFSYLNNNPAVFSTLEASVIMGNPQVLSQFITAMQTVFDNTTAVAGIKLIDTQSKENVLVYMMGGHLHAISESNFEKLKELNQGGE